MAASPGSSAAIASVLIASLLMHLVLNIHAQHLSQSIIVSAEAIVIITATVVMSAACVSNNNSQDLKVGYIVGATPWKQQLMLALGAIVAALIVPLIMQLLYQAYGIAYVVPHAGMNPANSLSAPPAAAMAAITASMFNQQLPYHIMIIGALILTVFFLLNQRKTIRRPLSLIGIAIGMYLPLDASTPLFIGSLISYWTWQHHKKHQITHDNQGVTVACGLVAGSAITNVALAIPLALMHHGSSRQPTFLSNALAALALIGICLFVYRSATKKHL